MYPFRIVAVSLFGIDSNETLQSQAPEGLLRLSG